MRLLPPGEEPEWGPVCPGDEWKEGSYRVVAEEESLQQVREAFEHCKATGRWPTMSATTAFFVRDRLEWAARFAEQCARPPHADAATTALPSFPRGTVRIDAVLWLAVEMYDHYGRPKRWRDYRRLDD